MSDQIPKRTAGLILAGGEGERYGRPKAFATLPDGRTFLDACCGTLLGAGASPVVATLPPGAEVPRIDGLDTLALPEPGMDMFGSLQTGLARLIETTGWQKVAVLPVDHPLVKADSISTLVNTMAPAAIPSFRGKHGHPVCIDRLVVERILAGELPGPTLRDVLRSVGAVDVPVDDIGVVTNCNTPDALRDALSAAKSKI
jgi:CTP:molybdopterin cytidylyltransferase MocA